MPSKIRMIQAIADQEVSELSDEMVRLAAAKDAEIADLEQAILHLQDGEVQTTLREMFPKLDAAKAEIATLTEQRDRAIADRNETRDRTYGTIRQLREQRGRAMAVVDWARRVVEVWCSGGALTTRMHSPINGLRAALDAEVAAETAPSLPETP